MAAVTSAVIGAASLAKGVIDAKKAKKSAQQAAEASQVDINSLDARTRELSKQNAIDSANLERQLTPEVSALRTGANQQLLSGLGKTDPDLARAKGMVGQNLGVPLNTPLLNAAIAKAQSDLALGGTLSTDAQNLATRQALSTAGTVGGGLGLGRDLVARDLGLNSMQVEQQRLQNASQLGGQELQLGQSNATNLLNNINLLRSINDNQFGQNLATAQYAQGIQRPIVGLDPSSVANLTVSNANNRAGAFSNLANTQGAQSQASFGMAGQMFGAGLAGFGARPMGGYTPSSPQFNSFGPAGPAYNPNPITINGYGWN